MKQPPRSYTPPTTFLEMMEGFLRGDYDEMLLTLEPEPEPRWPPYLTVVRPTAPDADSADPVFGDL